PHACAGNMAFQLGRQADAIARYRRALALAPDDDIVHSNLLLALNSLPGISRDELFEAHRAWGERVEARFAGHPPVPVRDPDPDRPLRIGYVSADFREHSVAFFVE